MWGEKKPNSFIPSCDKALSSKCQLKVTFLLHSPDVAAVLTVSPAFFLLIVVNRFNYHVSFSPFWMFTVLCKKFRSWIVAHLYLRCSDTFDHLDLWMSLKPLICTGLEAGKQASVFCSDMHHRWKWLLIKYMAGYLFQCSGIKVAHNYRFF